MMKINRREFLKACATAAVGGPIFSNARIDTFVGKRLPNIIFVFADDMGWGDCKINNPESKIPMPNLEKLAAEGMNFTNAYSPTALCAPTRYSVMTGNYTWRGRAEGGTWMFWQPPQIPDGQKTIGDILQAQGYRTAMFGKLHLGANFYKTGSNEYAQNDNDADLSRKFEDGPTSYGFDYSYLTLAGVQNQPYAYFENDMLVGDPADLMTWQAGTYGNSTINKTGIGMPYWDSSQIGPILAQKAIDFIDETHQMNIANGSQTPFFVYLSSPAAHSPHTPPDTFLGTPVKGVTGMSARADMIYELDVTLGKLIEAAEDRGLLGNTLVIFTSDNGGTGGSGSSDFVEFGHDAIGGLNGKKGEPLEGGFRVPFVAKWADTSTGQWHIPPGTVRDQVICAVDLAATFGAIGANKPGPYQANDSFNMLPVFLGDRGDDDPVRDHLYLFQRNEGKRVIREGDFKLIINYEGTLAEQLYNLADDPTETTNLINNPGSGIHTNRLFKLWQKLRGMSRTAPA